MSYAQELRCRECKAVYPLELLYRCRACRGALEVHYDYEALSRAVTREVLVRRPLNLWRYQEFLPIDQPRVGEHTGFTPLVKAERLGKKLGLHHLYIKDDSVNRPTFSFKDRVVSTAISKVFEFGLDSVACVSTGNLAHSVAALSRQAGLQGMVFFPQGIEPAKINTVLAYGPLAIAIDGVYDDVNRLGSQITDRFNIPFVNITLRPYALEGSKTVGFEIAEQLGWHSPDHVVVPVASGSLLTKVDKAFRELARLGWLSQSSRRPRLYAAQAAGCSPVSRAWKQGKSEWEPVPHPQTIAHSIAVGHPADGNFALQSLQESGGGAEEVTDPEIREAILLLAQTEGILTETAGGVALGATKKLAEQHRFHPDDLVVMVITGQGLKTLEALDGQVQVPSVIPPHLSAFEKIYAPSPSVRSTSTREESGHC